MQVLSPARSGVSGGAAGPARTAAERRPIGAVPGVRGAVPGLLHVAYHRCATQGREPDMGEPGTSDSALRRAAIGRLVAGALVLAGLLFVPAGTIGYWHGWVYLGVLLVAASALTAYLLRRDPALLSRRLRRPERAPSPTRVAGASTTALVATLLMASVDERLGLSAVPPWVVAAADVVIVLGWLLLALTLRENEYALRVAGVEPAQRVVSTGPYARVRHPLYLGALAIFVASPLALGSWWALVPAAAIPFALASRVRDEEKLLERHLEGYADYCRIVRHRLIPGFW